MRHPSSASSVGPFIWTWRVWGGDKETDRRSCSFLEMTSQPSFLHPFNASLSMRNSTAHILHRPLFSGLESPPTVPFITKVNISARCDWTEIWGSVCRHWRPGSLSGREENDGALEAKRFTFFYSYKNSNRDLMSLKVYLFTLMTFSCTCMLRDYIYIYKKKRKPQGHFPWERAMIWFMSAFTVWNECGCLRYSTESYHDPDVS